MKKNIIGMMMLTAGMTLAGELPQMTLANKEVKGYEVTVSAGPINKIFDGSQREREQTKSAAVFSFALESPSKAKIVYAGGVPKDLELRPTSRAEMLKVEENAAIVEFTQPEAVVLHSDSGAVMDVHLFANPPFSAPTGEKVRRFGPGEHRPGLLAPQSGETIVLDEGAVVHAELFVLNATNVTICGRGVLDFSEWERSDPRARAFREQHGLPKEDTEFACNPFVVHGSQQVLIEGITLKDAPFWTLIVRNGSTEVEIRNIKIIGNWRYNSDGINICASSRVRVHDCFIRSFDDCLVARAPYFAGDDGMATRDIIFERNRLWCDWGKNCEVWAGHKPTLMDYIVFRNNAFLHIHFTGCDVTTWFCSSNTAIRHVVFEDNEYDLGGTRYKTVFQTQKHQPFNLERDNEVNLLSVDAWAPAKNLGNQHFGPANDASEYPLAYDNIGFIRPQLFGAEGKKLTVKSETTTPYQHIRGLFCEGVPSSVEFITKGNTAIGRQDAQNHDQR